MLRELGADNVYAFATVDEALARLADGRADVGVLDVALGTTTSFPVAEVLRERATPFIFTTGYGESDMIPERFHDAPIVRKPYTLETLAAALARCLAPRRGS